ncbi:MAG: septum formation initiator family protein [Alphaproteobacteria bacterium]|nr:septum formation initiator family protein [Alphaproteobacteria bacterium]
MELLRLKKLDLLVSVGCFVLLGYFAWQAERGTRGLTYNSELNTRVKKLGNDFDEIKSKRKVLEDKVAELRPNTIDPDLLDEMARKTLNYVSQRDVIVNISN